MRTSVRRVSQGLPSVRAVLWFPQLGRPWLYLTSLTGTPLAVALATAQAFDLPEAVYVVSILVAALPIYSMTVAASAAAGQELYSWWGLRAQAWLHVGGAVSAAVSHWRDRPRPPRHAR